MYAKFFCKTGPTEGQEFFIKNKATIGSDRGNMIVLAHRAVSRFHAEIFFDENEMSFFVKNLGSTNGVKVDGVPVSKKEKLGKLHVITIATIFNFFFQFVEDTEAGDDNAESVSQPENRIPKTDADETVVSRMLKADNPESVKNVSALNNDFPFLPELRSPVKANTQTNKQGQGMMQTVRDLDFVALPSVLAGVTPLRKERPGVDRSPAAGGFFLELLSELYKKQRFYLKPGQNIIGRTNRCEVFIKNTSLSRQHAVITVSGDRLTIRDLGSTNRTYVYGMKISKETPIKPGIPIRFGGVDTKILSFS